MVVCMIMLVFMREPQRWIDSHGDREKKLGIMEALRKFGGQDRKYLVIAVIVYLSWTVVFKMATTFGGVYFVGVLGRTDFRTILTIAGLLLPVSALISGILLDKIGRNLVLIIGSLGSSVSLIGLAMSTSPLFFQAAFFFMAMILAWIYVYIAEIFPNEIRATGVGVAITGARFGYVIGPILSSALLVMFVDMVGFWLFGGILILIPLLTLAMKPLETKGKTLEEIEAER